MNHMGNALHANGVGAKSRTTRVCLIAARNTFALFASRGDVEAYLVLDEKLDTLDGSSGGLRDGGRDTTHYTRSTVSHHVPRL
jgi:hypothetical protein